MQIEPIYPPSRHVLYKACADCGGDVRSASAMFLEAGVGFEYH